MMDMNWIETQRTSFSRKKKASHGKSGRWVYRYWKSADIWNFPLVVFRSNFIIIHGAHVIQYGVDVWCCCCCVVFISFSEWSFITLLLSRISSRCVRRIFWPYHIPNTWLTVPINGGWLIWIFTSWHMIWISYVYLNGSCVIYSFYEFSCQHRRFHGN